MGTDKRSLKTLRVYDILPALKGGVSLRRMTYQSSIHPRPEERGFLERCYKKVLEFDWDEGNIGKNKKHKVEDKESEECFFDDKKIVQKDKIHSLIEDRYILLGRTKKKRLIYIIFTKRKNKIRIISARDVNKKEVYLYEKAT